MTVVLDNGGTVRVLPDGGIEFLRDGRIYRTDGYGSYAESARRVQAIAYGRDIRYVTR